MGVFDSFKELVTQKPVGLKKPDFYKSGSDAKMRLERLQQLHATAPDRVKPQLERDMKLLAYGIAGEESIAFELNNSYLPIMRNWSLNKKVNLEGWQRQNEEQMEDWQEMPADCRATVIGRMRQCRSGGL